LLNGTTVGFGSLDGFGMMDGWFVGWCLLVVGTRMAHIGRGWVVCKGIAALGYIMVVEIRRSHLQDQLKQSRVWLKLL